MGSIPGSIARGIFLVCLASACTSKPPFVGVASEVGDSERRSAVALEEAIERGLIEVITRDHNCTRTELGLVIKPLDRSQAWVRIDAGLQLVDPGRQDQTYLTTHTKYVRLPSRKNLLVTIPYVQRTRFRSLGIPSESTLSRCEDDRLLAFLSEINRQPVAATWKDLQFATWALSENIPFDSLHASSSSKTVIPGLHPPMNCCDLLRVVTLLERSGHKKEDFAIWYGALDEADRLTGVYEELMDKEDRRAIQSFRMVCDLYPLESASDVLVGCFDRHQGKSGLPYRHYAFEVLRKIGGPREIAVLKRVSVLESDPELFEQMEKAAQAMASPAK
jgi:hypothetical protein